MTQQRATLQVPVLLLIICQRLDLVGGTLTYGI